MLFLEPRVNKQAKQRLTKSLLPCCACKKKKKRFNLAERKKKIGPQLLKKCGTAL